MSVLNPSRRRDSARIARERLQILLSHERVARDLLTILREEILAVVAKHVIVEYDDVEVRVDRGKAVSALEINVKIPHPAGVPRAATF
jgi:cell division topological specificity factor